MKIGNNKGKKYNTLKDATHKLILKGLVAEATVAKSKNGNRLPHKYLDKVMKKHSAAFPWLNLNMLKNALKDSSKQSTKNQVATPAVAPPPPPVTDNTSNINGHPPPPPPHRTKGGLPFGSTDANKQNLDLSVTATLNAVVQKFLKE